MNAVGCGDKTGPTHICASYVRCMGERVRTLIYLAAVSHLISSSFAAAGSCWAQAPCRLFPRARLGPQTHSWSTMSADAQDRAEEMEALEAIFGDDFRAVAADTFELRIALEGRGDVVMCCHLPETYPSRTAPLYEFRASWLTGADEAVLAAGLDSIAAASQGEVVVFKWAEFLREEFATLPANSGPPCASTPRPTPAAEEEGSHCDNMEGGDEDVDHNLGAVSLLPHSMHREDGSVSAETIAYWEARIKHGPPHTERKSTFQAHVADVKSEAEAKQMVAALLTNNKIARATHNIMAFRLMPDGGHARGDCDDDGLFVPAPMCVMPAGSA